MTKLSPRTLRRLMMAGFAAGVIGNTAIAVFVAKAGVPPIGNVVACVFLAACFVWYHRAAERIEGNLEAWREK